VVSLPLAPVLPLVLTFGQGSSPAATCVSYDIYTNTITVACNSNLSSIYQIVNDKSVLEKDAHGVWILNAIIKVNPQAKLTIDRTDTSWLKITNKILQESQPNFISISGNAKIDGVKITSWDPFSDSVIRQNVKGSIPRPYIMITKGAGTVNVSNSEIASLGYNSFPSNGFSYSTGGNGSSIINNTFHDMWDGFYSDHVGFITIKNNKYYNNLRYGIDPHTGSHDLSIIGNLAYNNSAIGIICSENCYNILFNSNTVHNNGLAGLMFSRDTNNSTAEKNYAYNEKIGISIFSSSNDKVHNNLLKSTIRAIYIGGSSSGNHVHNNTVVNATVGIYFADIHPKNNVLENNNLNNITYPTMIIGTNNIGRNNVVVYNK
ncbi:MAG TPA: right-handed parallel beta-helix repeat-containing protein, partial [Nitrososphaeraceae archaeon]